MPQPLNSIDPSNKIKTTFITINQNKMKKITLIICLLYLCGCDVTLPYCSGLTDSQPINATASTSSSSTKIESNFAITFNPLLLPVILKYDDANGFNIVHTSEHQIITPLGFVGIHYSLSSAQEKTINGYKISSGDFVVGLINRTTEQKQVFKIEGYSKLKVVTEGKTTINAEAGYVEIDITDAKIKELKFVDNSKFTIVNTTDKKQKFQFGVENSDGNIKWSKCEIEPSSYKHSDIANWVKKFNSSQSARYLLKVVNDDSNDDKSSSITTKIDFGEVCQILPDNNGDKILLEKKTKD